MVRLAGVLPISKKRIARVRDRIIRRLQGLRKRLPEARLALREALGLGPKEALSRVLFEFARTHPDAYVIQIGAHDSTHFDPLRRYILNGRWRGILVEPVPMVFERLRHNYADVDGLIFENAAIAPSDGSKDLYYLPQTTERGLPRWYDAIASFDRDVLLSHERFIPDIEERVEVMTVPTLSFDSLCQKHGVTHVDFVQIDVEGYDWELLRSIDLERHRPPLLQFEELHMDEDTLDACVEFVGRHGYETMGNGMDRLCLNVDRLGPGDRRLRRTWGRLQRRAERSRAG